MGFAQGGAPANVLDIAPTYAGVVYGIANLFANIGGFFSPMAINFVTKDSVILEYFQSTVEPIGVTKNLLLSKFRFAVEQPRVELGVFLHGSVLHGCSHCLRGAGQWRSADMGT